MSSDRKLKRKENKKRKLEAYLTVAEQNETDRKKNKELKTENLPDSSSGSESNEPQIDENCKANNETYTSQKEMKKCLPLSERKKNQVSVKQLLPPDEFALLKQRLRAIEKEKRSMPKLYLTSIGTSAALDIPTSDRCPIFTSDLQNLVLYSLIFNKCSFKPRWCRMLRPNHISHRIVVVVEGVGMNDITSLIKHKEMYKETSQQIHHVLPRITSLLKTQLEFVAPITQNLLFTEEFLNVSFSMMNLKKILRSFKMKGKIDGHGAYKASSNTHQSTKKVKSETKIETGDKFDRRDLLVSESDLVYYNFPLQIPGSPGYFDDEYKFSKNEYTEVTSTSPMFGIDCEMCSTSKYIQELTSVSIVNEQHEVIYSTLVKPQNKIISYKTKYSGITKAMLQDVETTLAEVQEAIIELLPSDAILVGHSLDGDLKVLKLFHPYCIDTSLTYNLTGNRRSKSSLKLLTKMFIGEDIQTGFTGHDPSEDALATLKLAQLKLTKDIKYGDVISGYKLDWFENSYSAFVPTKPDDTNDDEKTDPEIVHYVTSIYHQIKKVNENGKNVLLTTPMGLKSYDTILPNIKDYIQSIVTEPGNKQLSRKVAQLAIENDFSLVHFKMDLSLSNCKTSKEKLHQFKKLDKRLKYIYKNAAPKSFVTVIFTGSSYAADDESNGSNGFVLLDLKIPQFK